MKKGFYPPLYWPNTVAIMCRYYPTPPARCLELDLCMVLGPKARVVHWEDHSGDRQGVAWDLQPSLSKHETPKNVYQRKRDILSPFCWSSKSRNYEPMVRYCGDSLTFQRFCKNVNPCIKSLYAGNSQGGICLLQLNPDWVTHYEKKNKMEVSGSWAPWRPFL